MTTLYYNLLFCTIYFSFALAGHRGTCLRPLHIFALLCFAFAPSQSQTIHQYVDDCQTHTAPPVSLCRLDVSESVVTKPSKKPSHVTAGLKVSTWSCWHPATVRDVVSSERRSLTPHVSSARHNRQQTDDRLTTRVDQVAVICTSKYCQCQLGQSTYCQLHQLRTITITRSLSTDGAQIFSLSDRISSSRPTTL